MTTGRQPRTFPERAAASAWVGADPRLADAITEVHVERGAAQRALADRAVALAQPGPVSPLRLARHATAASVSRALRVATGLPAAVSTRRPLTDPGGFLRDAAVEAFVDQLALGGPASAELARLIEGGGELFPALLRRELGRREIRAIDLAPETVQAVIDESFAPSRGSAATGPLAGNGTAPAVRLALPAGAGRSTWARPLTGTAVAGLYPATAGPGSPDAGDPLLVRVRRPRIARDLLTDSRLAAGAATVLARLAPEAGGMGPLGFVRLVLRQNLEATDLCFEALDLVELGMILEELDRDGVVVARPRPGLIAERALAIEHTEGTPLLAGGARRVDVDAVLPALVGITLEAAIGHGVFWADPAPEHLLVRPDGRLAVVGVGTLGRFTPELRLAAVRTLKAVLTGDFAGMVEGMRVAGALGPDVDTAGLMAELSASDRLDPMKVLLGGEPALLSSVNALVGIMLTHRLEPPVEVTLLLRTLFATARLVSSLTPGGGPGLTAALMGLLPRLPDLLAAAEDGL
jgi:hypothetical protein